MWTPCVQNDRQGIRAGQHTPVECFFKIATGGEKTKITLGSTAGQPGRGGNVFLDPIP